MPEAMNTDTDMTENDDVSVTQQQQQLDDVQNRTVRELIDSARQLINEGKPNQAMQAVVLAMRTQGGNDAVVQFMRRARELFMSRLHEASPVDQLATLFAECAIAEAQPSQPQSSLVPDVHGTSILAQTGRMQVVMDAFSDGSSFICLQCGGLVSNQRKDEHYAYWCCKS